MNPYIESWLDAGQMLEALLGSGRYFLANHTYREHHDVLLVLRTVLEWTRKRSSSGLPDNDLANALATLVEEDPERCLDVLLAYAILGDEIRVALPVDHFGLLARLAQCPQVDHQTLNATNRRFAELKGVKLATRGQEEPFDHGTK